MALITIPEIKVGDEITSTAINSFIASVNLLPTRINQENVRDQGIDRRNIAANCATLTATNANFLYKSDANHTMVTGTSTVALTTPAIKVGGASLTLNQGEKAIIYCSFSYYVVYNATHLLVRTSGAGGYQVNFELQWKYSAGSYALVTGTKRFSNIVLADYGGGARIGYHFLPKGSMTIVTVLHNTTGSAKSYEVALAACSNRSIGTGNSTEAIVKYVQMSAKIVRK
tara:strand:+ start:653 stop:1336 length:684 start_codon:yes stop_codon:yes gene_type:complete